MEAFQGMSLSGQSSYTWSEFDWMGMRVEEYLFPVWQEGLSKIMWVREPIERMVVGEFVSPLFHADFKDGDESKARAAVREAFTNYWQSPKKSEFVEGRIPV